MPYPAYNIFPHLVFPGLLSAAPAGSLPDGGYALSGLQHLSAPGFPRHAKRSASRQFAGWRLRLIRPTISLRTWFSQAC
ncbi:putative membrane protein [Enterobacter cloacae S611]|uniref:Membrane protein n=1 Tax=Enterobacter cloacae S611 TaxID=1399146 RepID=A0ABP2ZWD3_ENTCL|nr:putative membrane protein [Enterobacter cloacae S611]